MKGYLSVTKLIISVLCKLIQSIWQFNFRGIISSCFEPHLTVYTELEEKTLMENLEKLVQVRVPIRETNITLDKILNIFQFVLSFSFNYLLFLLIGGNMGY